MKKLAILMAAAAIGLTSPANAALIINQSPDATGLAYTFTAANTATSQNWLMRITLTAATTLNGIDIYSDCRAFGCGSPSLGTAAIVKIRNDVGGIPDGANLFTFSTLISAIDSVGSTARPALERVHADFAGASLAAGSYWIGLSGDGTELGQNLNLGIPSSIAILGGDSATVAPWSTAFNVYDNSLTGAIPEPASWALMILGFGLVGGALRSANERRRKSSVRVTYA
jgi:PEP-CTERM motif